MDRSRDIAGRHPRFSEALYRCTTVPEGPEAQEKIRAELRERIDALNGIDENGARAIVADAVKAGLSGLAVETLVGPLAKKLGVKETYARNFWNQIKREKRLKRRPSKKRSAKLSPRKSVRPPRGRKRASLRRARGDAKRLELSCREIAHDPKLLLSRRLFQFS